jgi:hypothetical protein
MKKQWRWKMDINNTLQFSFHYSLKKYHEIDAVFEDIWETIPTEGKQKKTVADMKKYLKYYICNMINAMYQEKSVVIPMRAEAIASWEILDLPEKTEYARRVPWVTLTNALVDAGWIHKSPGFRAMTYQKLVGVSGSELAGDDWVVFHRKGCLTRVAGTEKLHKLLREAKVYPEEIPSPLIILRKEKENKKDKPEEIEFTDTEYTLREKRFLEALNKVYDENDFRYIPDDEMLHFVNPYAFYQDAVSYENLTSQTINGVEVLSYPRGKRSQQRLFPRVCAIYNNGTFQSGGRLYSKPLRGESYMNIYREDRHNIRINGKRTVEPDYKSLHIALSYAMQRIQLDSDPYNLYPGDGAMRTIIKKLLLTMINGSSIEEAIKAMNQTIYELRCQNVICERDLKFLIACNRSEQIWDQANAPDWKELICKLQELHNPIRDYFCSGAGIRLQRMDSTIMKQVLWHFVQQGIPCLPVHDSAIIAVQHEEELKEVMHYVYKEITGFECGVE